MRILIFSDLHLHKWAYGSSIENGMNSRLRAQADVFGQILNSVIDNEIEEVVFCGDLFHLKGSIADEVLKVAYEGFQALTAHAPVTLLVGNHDTNRKDRSIHSLHWLRALPNLNVVNSEYHNNWGSFLSYTEDEQVLLKFLKEVPNDNMVFLHQGIRGLKMGSGFVVPNEIFHPDMVPYGVPRVFTGHYHKSQVLGRIRVVGSTMQHDWGDSGDRRGWLYMNTVLDSCKFFESKAPRFEYFSRQATSDEWFSYVNNNFIRVYTNQNDDLAQVRQSFMDLGARSVEFVQNEKKSTSRQYTLKPDGMDLEEIISAYEKAKDVDSQSKEIKEKLMNDTYETPTFSG